jgi:hypothetical protein
VHHAYGAVRYGTPEPLVSGPLYPRRDRDGIARALDAIAARLVAPPARGLVWR